MPLMNVVELKTRLKRYSSYLDIAPAPQGFRTPRIPTDLRRWQHAQPDVVTELEVKRNAPNFVAVRVVSSGQVVEQFLVDLAWKVNVPDLEVVQFSARFPSIMCKYLVSKREGISMKRFQMGFGSTTDFDRCCTLFRAMGLTVKTAGVLRPGNGDTLARVNSTFSGPYCSTPPGSRMLKPLKSDSIGAGTNGYTLDSFSGGLPFAPNCTVHQETESLDTQSLSGVVCHSQNHDCSEDMSLVRESTHAAINWGIEQQVHRDALLEGPHMGLSGYKPVTQKDAANMSQPEQCVEVDSCVPDQALQTRQLSSVPRISGMLPLLSTVQTEAKHMPIPQGSYNMSQKSSDAQSTDIQPPREVSNMPTPTSKSPTELYSSKLALAHPLKGLADRRLNEGPLELANLKKAVNTTLRPEISQDMIKNKLKDRGFRDWVCVVNMKPQAFFTIPY
ncbi:LADA_0E02278g1_1 [Lachancea dasiensis]|uniref:LADA_0E02278g1_1 n=1 Tax=Lachancea dasiensis TaxID=1072105 RepID=A0A1G4JAQ5_9SACH|nr:LADA_0E02278g1_1 [Lachancea dasiensis]